MKDRQVPGEEPEEFRKQLHELADWIADYRENIGRLRVAPNDPPGTITAALPAQPPEKAETFEKIMADVDRRFYGESKEPRSREMIMDLLIPYIQQQLDLIPY